MDEEGGFSMESTLEFLTTEPGVEVHRQLAGRRSSEIVSES